MADNIMDALNQAYENETDICIINPDTRTIDVPSKWRFLGVTSDEKSKRVPFKCPRYVDDIDLMDYSLYINYENADGTKDAHHITDVTLDGDFITFTWLLSRQVTAYKGDVHYILCAKIVEDTEIINEWNTVPAVGTVSEGLEATSQIVDRDEDVIEQILLDIKSLEEAPRWDSEIIEISSISKSTILVPANLGKVYKYIGTMSIEFNWAKTIPITQETIEINATINPNDTFVVIKYSVVEAYPLVINKEGLATEKWVTNEIYNITRPSMKILADQVISVDPTVIQLNNDQWELFIEESVPIIYVDQSDYDDDSPKNQTFIRNSTRFNTVLYSFNITYLGGVSVDLIRIYDYDAKQIELVHKTL